MRHTPEENGQDVRPPRESSLARERELLEASERRITRLGFDLHDGPLQDLVVLSQDVRLFVEQLDGVAGVAHGDRARLRGRVEDINAQLEALEASLRQISTSAHASVLTSRPFASAVVDLAKGFAARTGIQPEVRLDGELASISPSQRITLLSVIGEALNNVREHSDATEVQVTIALDSAGVQAWIVDNGQGFDVEAMLVSAARRGRIGLAGIYERVRLLGGTCEIDSRAGGPTSIAICLPPWKPEQGSSAEGIAA
jgi:signal transduction histidine kinase